MNDDRSVIHNKVCYVDGYAYVAGGNSKEKAEKFDYEQKEWIALFQNYRIKDSLFAWSSALTFIPQEIKQETKEDEETKEELEMTL